MIRTKDLTIRGLSLLALIVTMTVMSSRISADTGTCGGASTTLPFTDVPAASVFFCSIAEAYFSALTNGTTPTTYTPSAIVTREQMAAFTTRTMDQSLKRGSKRAALDQYWTTQETDALSQTTIGDGPILANSDGADVWVANQTSGTVSRVRASDSKLLDTWTGADQPYGVLCAMGKVFITGGFSPGKLYQIDPTLPPGPVTLLTGSLPNEPFGIAFDGQRIWTANDDAVSIISLNPISVTNVTPGVFSLLYAMVYDGANMWVTDDTPTASDKLYKLDANGAIVLTLNLGSDLRFPAFDGTNLWVPVAGTNKVSVVRAVGSLSGTVLADLTGNGLSGPFTAAFDGERIVVTNFEGDSVSVWKASDFSPLGSFTTGAGSGPTGACSDGVNFWISHFSTGKLARF